MAKIAIILHAEPGTHDSMGRAAHSLVYTKELKDAGHNVQLIFDGGGTGWIVELNKEDNILHPLFIQLRDQGLITGACNSCMGTFEVNKQMVKEAGVPAISEFMGHPSVARLIGQGYQIITL